MVVAGVVLIALALAVVVLAPRLLTRSAWTIDRPRTALVAWSVAVLLGVLGFVVGTALVVMASNENLALGAEKNIDLITAVFIAMHDVVFVSDHDGNL